MTNDCPSTIKYISFTLCLATARTFSDVFIASEFAKFLLAKSFDRLTLAMYTFPPLFIANLFIANTIAYFVFNYAEQINDSAHKPLLSEDEHTENTHGHEHKHEHDEQECHHHHSELTNYMEMAAIGVPFTMLTAGGTFITTGSLGFNQNITPILIIASALFGLIDGFGSYKLHTAGTHKHYDLQGEFNKIESTCGKAKASYFGLGVLVGHPLQGYFSSMATLHLLSNYLPTWSACAISAVIGAIVTKYEGWTEGGSIINGLRHPEQASDIHYSLKGVLALTAAIHGAIPCVSAFHLASHLEDPTLHIAIATLSIVFLGIPNAKGFYDVNTRHLNDSTQHFFSRTATDRHSSEASNTMQVDGTGENNTGIFCNLI